MEDNISPVPESKEVELTFFDALREVLNGKKVTKREWGNNFYYGALRDGIVVIHKPDGEYYQWIISEADMQGVDWVVIDNP